MNAQATSSPEQGNIGGTVTPNQPLPLVNEHTLGDGSIHFGLYLTRFIIQGMNYTSTCIWYSYDLWSGLTGSFFLKWIVVYNFLDGQPLRL